jgi:myo-inositol-1(or 4)-monophosphatase
MGFRGRPVRTWEKEAGAGPVTEADHAVNDRLRAILRGARPDYGWLSEEDHDDLARLRAERVFIVDPIDGTRAFIAGDPGFAHAIAVAEAGRITAAVVHLPALGRVFAAEAGGPATCNGAPVRVAERMHLIGATVLTAKATLAPENWKASAPPAVTRVVRPSLAWRLCLVAEGAFDAALTLRPAWEWDIAAGTLIAECAGARVTDRAGRPIGFNSHEARAEGLIAAAPAVWQGLADAMK